MPRGRERVLDEGKQREVCALVATGCSLQAAAHYVECAPNTIRREAARNPDFGRRFREARLQAQLSPLQAMRKAAASNWRAAAWMLERGDPEHFARRPAPAFRPKQAQTLRNDITAILSAEIENPFLLGRIKKQIQHLIEYSIDGVMRVERTDRQLRSVFREIDDLERKAEQCDWSSYGGGSQEPLKEPPQVAPTSARPTASSRTATSNGSGERTAPPAAGAPKSGPTAPVQPSNPEDLDPGIANLPVTWGDMTKVFQRLRISPQYANGQPPVAPGANGQPTKETANTANTENVHPTRLPPPNSQLAPDAQPAPDASPPSDPSAPN